MDLEELCSRIVLRTICILRNTVPGQGVHGQLVQRTTGRWLQAHHGWILPGRLRGVRTGVWRPPAVAETWYPGVRGGGWKWADEFASGLPANFFVFLDVDVDGQNSHGLSHDKGQSSKVERPAVGVRVFFVVVTAFFIGVSCIAGDVDDNSNNVAQAWWEKKEEIILSLVLTLFSVSTTNKTLSLFLASLLIAAAVTKSYPLCLSNIFFGLRPCCRPLTRC